jgi:FkbM family methyltransferase
MANARARLFSLEQVVLKRLRAYAKRWLIERFDIPDTRSALMRLQKQGFNPSVIADVGAYRGEFALMCLEVWPQARIVCFEPLPHMIAALHALSETLPIRVYPVALGAKSAPQVCLYCAETASSLLPEHHATHPSVSCEQRTLDEAMSDYGHSCDFLKLDVQGYELEVLKGGKASLQEIKAVLAEVNLLDIYKGVPLATELVAWLNARGFVPFDICGLARRPLDRTLWQADVIFVPRDSSLRADKRWI